MAEYGDVNPPLLLAAAVQTPQTLVIVFGKGVGLGQHGHRPLCPEPSLNHNEALSKLIQHERLIALVCRKVIDVALHFPSFHTAAVSLILGGQSVEEVEM